VLALGLSVGAIMFFDLRLLGITMRRLPVSEVFRQVKPWMFIGYAIMFITGALLFWSYAAKCYESIYFQIKMVLLLVAGINIAVYHMTIDRRRDQWEKAPIPPLQARLAGLFSLILWTAVIAVGRTMAYNL
jgi:hypothetical protein